MAKPGAARCASIDVMFTIEPPRCGICGHACPHEVGDAREVLADAARPGPCRSRRRRSARKPPPALFTTTSTRSERAAIHVGHARPSPSRTSSSPGSPAAASISRPRAPRCVRVAVADRDVRAERRQRDSRRRAPMPTAAPVTIATGRRGVTRSGRDRQVPADAPPYAAPSTDERMGTRRRQARARHRRVDGHRRGLASGFAAARRDRRASAPVARPARRGARRVP